MDSVKKFLRFLSSAFFYSVMLILVIIVFMFLAYFIDQKQGQKEGKTRSPLFGAYVIISPSMVPAINVQDAVVTVRVSEDKIKINDIITFLSKEIETQGTPITHRVIGTVKTDTGTKYRTKGDNNNTEDFALIGVDEVLGKVYLRIPLIGYVQTFLTKPIGWVLIIVVPCLLIIGSDVIKLIKTLSVDDQESKPDNIKNSKKEPVKELNKKQNKEKNNTSKKNKTKNNNKKRV